MTGGAATMTLTYQGRTFPICCTGCRDEFNENPEKYIKKASLMLGSQAGKAKSGQPAPARVSRFEDAFAGDVADSTEPAKPASKPQKTSPAPSVKPDPAEASPIDGTARRQDEARSAVKKDAGRKPPSAQPGPKPRKAGKTSAALGYYRRVVKDFTQPAGRQDRRRADQGPRPRLIESVQGSN